ncbi:MAG: cyanophycin synthetase [Halioglobus sp.]|jgi:cyanophycin synthetase
MKILSTNVYVGPNTWARFPVIKHVLDLGVLEQWPSAKLGADFIDPLVEALPGLQEHGCSYRETGGFLRRLREDEGTWMGHIMEHCALEIQCVAGSDVTFGRTRSTGEPRQYNMVYAYRQRDVGREAGELALKLLLHLLPKTLQEEIDTRLEQDFDFQEELKDFVLRAQKREFGPSTASLVKAAEDRDIPWLRLNQYSLVQFGHGVHQQRIQATITSETRHIAVEIACDKEDTHQLLNDLGLPVPQQRMIYSAKRAVAAAEHIGYPVVVKPLNANHGRGVSINLTTPEQIEAAFEMALEQGTGRAVLVESYIEGFDHRMLLVDNELVAVAKRVPGHVVGNGSNTIRELVDKVNEDPRRGIGHEKVLTQLELDKQASRLLAEAGKDENSVLDESEIFYLRSTANLSTGGTAIDMTDVVHPDNREMAVRAVRAVGLDVAGVDFLTPDITRSYKDIGGAIVEVNAAPGFRMHVAPSEGEPRDVAGKVMDMLFGPGETGRIPLAAITGTNGKTTTSRMLAHILKDCGHTVGLTSTDGIQIDGKITVKGDMTGPASAQIVLRDPSVDFAVMETARGGILRAGLGYHESNVAACINVDADHLGLNGIDTLEQLAEVKRVVVETAKNVAVLNADDINCLKMADYCDAKRICYVTLNANNGLVREHIRAGGMACVLERGINGDMITFYDNGSHMPLLWSHLIPATMEGKALHNVQNAMFAATMAYCFDKEFDEIRHGLRTFDSSFFQAPGRMNVFNEYPFKVILDYAHNPAAFRVISEMVDRMEVKGRKIAVISMPGDRRDEDITESAGIVAGHFDHYICKADDNRRGRTDDEVPQLLRSGLLANNVAKDSISIVPDEQDAIAAALEEAAEGDLLVIFGDNITRCWKQIIYHGGDREVPENLDITIDETISGVPLGLMLEDGMQLISDDKGVRLARSEEEGD